MWYKEIWDAILEEEDNDNPFIEFAWFYNWWQIVGRKERVELYAIEHEGTIMAFPLYSVYSLRGKGVCFCRRKHRQLYRGCV